jgi:hypothetical protein
MPENKVRNNVVKTGNGGWALALERAELALYKNRARRSQIMKAIRFFQDQIKSGVPWPLEPDTSKKK